MVISVEFKSMSAYLIEDALEKNCFRLDSIEVLIGDRSGIRFIAGNNAPQEMYISV